MENLDLMVLRTLRTWRLASKRALLATVIRTWGSSPRPVGSIMALSEDGSVVGSVSGGCIEDDLIYRHTLVYKKTGVPGIALGNAVSDAELHPMPSGSPAFIKYGVSADEAHRFGLPCGGTLELLLEYDPDAHSLDKLVTDLEAGQLVQRIVRLSDGVVMLRPSSAPESLSITSTELVNTFGPEYRMLLIGAGQLAEYLATMAIFNGFAVTVCDPREEYRSAWSVMGARLVAEMPDDIVVTFNLDRRSCVVALTHDPKLDDLALLEALKTEAFYVGAIGSRRNTEARRLRMIEHFGQSEDDMNRLRGPVGVYIGSKTPSEIAVSVMAEILAVKNGVDLPRNMTVGHAKNRDAVPANDSGDIVCV